MTDYSVYQNQLHQFYSFSGFTSGMKYVTFNNPSFAVKEIKFDFAYNYKSAGYSSVVITADIANGELVGMTNNISYTYNDGKADVIVYNDGFSASKSVSYIPKEPIRPNGAIGFNFLNVLSGTISNFSCTIHVEFLGY